MSNNKIIPKLNLEAFNCHNCGVYTKQHWYYLKASERFDGFGLQYQNDKYMISNCEHCKSPTFWLGDMIIFPISNDFDPNPDLPHDVKQDFEEASRISNLSPRGAAALLRLAIQKLCKHLGQPGKNINEDIKNLVANGLPQSVQQALDIVRVIGNDAVHPGTIDLRDDKETVNSLFMLVNFIAQKLITEPKEILLLYNNLPSEKLKGIENRDQNSNL